MTALEIGCAAAKERSSFRYQSRSTLRKTEQRPVLRSVPSREDRDDVAPIIQRRRPVVRPDRPASRYRGLSSVPTAVTPATADIPLGEWAIEDRLNVRPVAHVRRIAEAHDRDSIQRDSIGVLQARNTKQARPVVRPATSAVVAMVTARVVSATVIVAVVALLGFLLGSIMGLAPEAGSVITVQAGQTLEQIAASVPGGASVNEVMSDILALNVIDHGTIFAGQELVLPKY